MNRELTREAPAKINLWLRILRRREDGFHELETRMATIGLADRLEFRAGEPGDGLRFSCSDPGLPGDESNLVVRAVRSLEGETGRGLDVAIALEKRIPHGAGLGGGSSDAAATLLGVNALFELGLGEEKLRELAAGIGSDVPFFLKGGVCDCRGRGERAEPVDGVEVPPVFLVKPPFSVPTPWAYQRWRDSKEIAGVDYGEQAYGGEVWLNDLERPVFEKYVLLADLKTWFKARSETELALMSGSGATVFAVLRDDALREELGQAVKAEFGETMWVW